MSSGYTDTHSKRTHIYVGSSSKRTHIYVCIKLTLSSGYTPPESNLSAVRLSVGGISTPCSVALPACIYIHTHTHVHTHTHIGGISTPCSVALPKC